MMGFATIKTVLILSCFGCLVNSAPLEPENLRDLVTLYDLPLAIAKAQDLAMTIDVVASTSTTSAPLSDNSEGNGLQDSSESNLNSTQLATKMAPFLLFILRSEPNGTSLEETTENPTTTSTTTTTDSPMMLATIDENDEQPSFLDKAKSTIELVVSLAFNAVWNFATDIGKSVKRFLGSFLF